MGEDEDALPPRPSPLRQLMRWKSLELVIWSSVVPIVV